MCPTPTGHVTDRPNKFNVTERELAKRKVLRAQIAEELSRPLIDADLLTAEERKRIPRRRGKANSPPSHLLKAWGWKLPRGVSGAYRAGTPQKPPRTSRRWERRIGAN